MRVNLEARAAAAEQRKAQTRERLLDAAEELFAHYGLYGVTVRNVSDHVGVDSALIPYYFGTKRGMFDAVFARRAEILNAVRVEAMAAYEAQSGGYLTPRGVVAAFIDPLIEMSLTGEPGWKNYFRLVALVTTLRPGAGRRCITISIPWRASSSTPCARRCRRRSRRTSTGATSS